MDPQIVQAILDNKVAILTTLANTSMLWWVSAVVFCASLLGTVWMRRKDLFGVPFLPYLGFLLYFFFGSIVLYGVLVTVITTLEFIDIRSILTTMGLSANLFNGAYLWLIIGMPVGTSSFVIFVLVWHFFWRSLKVTNQMELAQAFETDERRD